jgi:hypothetical protein
MGFEYQAAVLISDAPKIRLAATWPSAVTEGKVLKFVSRLV